MIANKPDELVHRLVVLGMRYPAMRFGQLMCLAATLAGDEGPSCGAHLKDADIVDAISRHLAEQPRSRVESGRSIKTLTQQRGALIDTLRVIRNEFPEWN